MEISIHNLNIDEFKKLVPVFDECTFWVGNNSYYSGKLHIQSTHERLDIIIYSETTNCLNIQGECFSHSSL